MVTVKIPPCLCRSNTVYLANTLCLFDHRWLWFCVLFGDQHRITAGKDPDVSCTGMSFFTLCGLNTFSDGCVFCDPKGWIYRCNARTKLFFSVRYLLKNFDSWFCFQNCALLSEFLQDVLIKKEELPTRPTNCDDCTRNRLCQVNEQPHGQFKQNYIFQNLQNLFPTDTSPSSLGGDVVGCLLFHHSQQMACNVHAITAIVSTNGDKPRQQVVSREQKRIGSAIYPTASLLNHACDPDVIVRWVFRLASKSLLSCFIFLLWGQHL